MQNKNVDKETTHHISDALLCLGSDSVGDWKLVIRYGERVRLAWFGSPPPFLGLFTFLFDVMNCLHDIQVSLKPSQALTFFGGELHDLACNPVTMPRIRCFHIRRCLRCLELRYFIGNQWVLQSVHPPSRSSRRFAALSVCAGSALNGKSVCPWIKSSMFGQSSSCMVKSFLTYLATGIYTGDSVQISTADIISSNMSTSTNFPPSSPLP